MVSADSPMSGGGMIRLFRRSGTARALLAEIARKKGGRAANFPSRVVPNGNTRQKTQ
jgi:hypothetical protein